LISEIDINSENFYSEYVDQIFKLDISPMEIAYLPKGISTPEYYNGILQAVLSEQAHTFIYEVADNCVTFSSVNDVAQYIELSKLYAKENFKGIELDVVLTGLTVFKYSSQLWFSQEEEGMGLGSIFVENYEKPGMGQMPAKAPSKISEAKKDALKKCLIADGASAASAAWVVSALAPWYPINVGAMVSIALSAGVGSVIEMLRILDIIHFVAPDEPDVVIKWKDNIKVDGEIITLPPINPYFPVSK
jgi:hypothetical protein